MSDSGRICGFMDGANAEVVDEDITDEFFRPMRKCWNLLFKGSVGFFGLVCVLMCVTGCFYLCYPHL